MSAPDDQIHHGRTFASFDEPVYRAVAIAPPDMYQLRTSGPGFTDPSASRFRPYATVSSGPQKGAQTSYQPSPSRSNWKVEDDSLGDVPPYYPLEKSQRVVSRREGKPSEIACRLSDAFRVMSVAAEYDDKRVTAQLVSCDHVEMNVNMFKHTSGGTIVEVQKRKGCSISYHQLARRFLDAAQGITDPTTLDSEPMNSSTVVKETSETLLLSEQERDNTIVAVEIAGNLLKKDRIDANKLGMESLFLLTQPEKTSLLTALITSRVVLCGTTGPLGELDCGASSLLRKEEEDALLSTLGIRETILSLIQYKKLAEEEGDDSSVEGAHTEDLIHDECEARRPSGCGALDSEHMDLLHNLALAVLANSLDVIANQGTLSETLQVNDWLGSTKLLSSLIEVLGRAATRPHDACLSARCLGTLVQASREARELAQRLDALAVVNRAKDIGKGSHMKLEKETEGVYKTLTAEA